MSKGAMIFLMFINAFFFFTNVIFLAGGTSSQLHFVAAFFCLCGFMASWLMYRSAEQ